VAVVISTVVRVGLTSLGSHWTMTAVAGAGVGYLAARGLRGGGALRAAACLAVAIAMHLLFDAPGPSLAILLKVLVNFVVVLAFYLWLRRGYRARARAALARQVAAGEVPGVEATALLTRRRRRRRQRQIPIGPVREEFVSRQLAALAGVEREAAS
jgi:hypothetical protein